MKISQAGCVTGSVYNGMGMCGGKGTGKRERCGATRMQKWTARDVSELDKIKKAREHKMY